MLISLYGINNIGKSTQVKLLSSRIRELGFTCEQIKYPIYHLEPTGSRINYFLRNPQAPRISGESLQMLYIQNRQDYEPFLKQSIEDHDIVLAEDYIGTGIAWGMTQGVPLNWLERMNNELLSIFPDLEILLDGQRFIEGKEDHHMNEDDEASLDECRKNFLFLAKRYKWPVVNANSTVEQVTEKLWDSILPTISLLRRS